MSAREVLTIFIVNESKKKIAATPDMTIEALFTTVADKVGVQNKGIFALVEQLYDAEQDMFSERYLDPKKTLQEEGINKDSTLFFKMHFVKSPKQELLDADPITQELICEQTQLNIVREVYPCIERIAIRLAALDFQAKFGDFDPKKHRVGYLNKIGLSAYLPKTVSRHDYAYWQERLFSLHETLCGMSKREALRQYCDLARTIPFFGMTFFEIKDSVGNDLLAAVAEDGLHLFKASNVGHEQTIKFQHLRSWKGGDGGIDVDYVTESGEAKDAFFVLPRDQMLEMLLLLDGYYALLPEELKTKDQKPNDGSINMLGTSELYNPPHKRIFFGRFCSRLEYLKGYYLEICLNAVSGTNTRITPLREFCWQIDKAIDFNQPLSELDLSAAKDVVDDTTLEYILKAFSSIVDYVPERNTPWEENLVLRKLNLSNSHISMAGLMLFDDLFKHLRQLCEFEMSFCALENKGALVLAPAIGRLPYLEKLTFNSCNIGNKGIMAILEAASDASKREFRALVARGNRVTERAVTQFLEHFLENPNCNLKHLDLADNDIEQKGLELLLKALESNKSLEYLDISQNPSSSKQLGPRIAQLLGRNQTLRSLVCADGKLGAGLMGPIAQTLRNSSLLHLNLSGNAFGKLDEEEIEALCSALTGAECLLQELNISNNALDVSFGDRLAKALCSNTHLKKLFIGNNQLADAETGTLPGSWAELLSQNELLETLDLTSCGLMTQGMIDLMNRVTANRSLRELILDQNHQAHEGLEAVEPTLQSSPEQCGLESLSLNGCKVNDALIQKIIPNNKKIKRLSLRSNEFTKVGLNRALDLMKTERGANPLEELDISSNKNLTLFDEDLDKL